MQAYEALRRSLEGKLQQLEEQAGQDRRRNEELSGEMERLRASLRAASAWILLLSVHRIRPSQPGFPPRVPPCLPCSLLTHPALEVHWDSTWEPV